MKRGFFLVIEGPDGAGKSTLARSLVERMATDGLDPVAVREPGGTPPAEHARAVLLDPESGLAPHTELLFLTAARAHLVQAIIRPALKAGRIVVSDRYTLSSLAYQSAGSGLPVDDVRMVNRVATQGLEPDLWLVLDLSAEAGRARQHAAGKVRDRFEREGAEFHERVVEAYRAFSGPTVRHLDASPRAPEVLDLAWTILAEARPDLFQSARR